MATVTGRGGGEAIAPVVGRATSGRRRRPSGEPPPLPRVIPASTFWYLAALVATTGLEIALAFTPLRRWITRADDSVLDAVTGARSGPLTAIMRTVEQLGSANSIRVLGWATIAVLLIGRRFRHLIAYLAVLLVVVTASGSIAFALGRMRPTGVSMIGPWKGYAHPSVAVAIFAAVAVGAVYTLAPSGRWRTAARAAAAALVLALGIARLYLGVDHPTDVLAALAIGWAFSVVVYRLAIPDEVFAVRYRHGNRAHLELGGARGPAIVRALEQQLGIEAESVELFGLEASAGSTPLRIRTRAGASLFGKLYALSHLRSDRSYKLARMVLYGRLEDEKSFATVRRLVEYEDHMLRLLRDNGLPVPLPHGFVEITPEREYVIVMSFVEGAHDLGAEPVGEQEIDEALRVVRKLWQAGVAHRDIKPSNLLVKDHHVALIDVAFAAVRPTPWRQAVDLANMMLTLALVSDAETVYRRAVLQFAPEDIAEGFAACRSVTIPTQLRTRLRADPRDLVAEFRRLAPERAAVPIQVWSLRRVGVTFGVLLIAGMVVLAVYSYARVAGLL